MQSPTAIKPYLTSAEDVLRSLATTVDRGLSGSEAQDRFDVHGPNELVEKDRKTAWRMLLAQVREVMVLILLAAVIISLFLREYIDAGVIFVIVMLNTLLGFWQEYKAENAMAALKKMATPMCGSAATAGSGKYRPRNWSRATSCSWKPAISCRPTAV